MEPKIFRYIFKNSMRQQAIIVLLSVISFPILYYSLELPKIIVNEAIGPSQNEEASIDAFPVDVYGFQLEQIEFLMALSLAFLGLVVVNGGFKYFINVFQGQTGERLLRRLRFDLFSRVLRFPLPHFKKMSQGEIIPMITAEVEPLGGFMAAAIAQPTFQGGQLVVYLYFIFAQDPILGAAAIIFYPIQGWLIPYLQKRVNALGKQRVRNMRAVSDKIGEAVSGVGEVHAHDASAWHRADIATRLGKVYDIRYEIFRRKYFIKFLNNFINQLTPFFFYSIGGYLVIQGDITFGALVAVLAAYKDLAGPWKELLTWYQLKEDARIKYEQVIEQFQPADMLEPDQWDEPATAIPMTGSLQLANVSYGDDGSPVLTSATLDVPLDKHMAIVGGGSSGKEELAMLIARLIVPSGGQIRLGERDYQQLPETVTGRQVAYVGPTAYVFAGTLMDNLLYGLRHRPLIEPDYKEAAARERARFAAEAAASGNVDYDLGADWVDYDAAGVTTRAELQSRVIDVLEMVGLADDVYAMGLRGTIDPTSEPDLAKRILSARIAMHTRLAEPDYSNLVELFDDDFYNTNATVAENLLFGTPRDSTSTVDDILEHPFVIDVLEAEGLRDDFVNIGMQVAETTIELFADLPPTHEFFEQFSFISADDLPEFRELITRAKRAGDDADPDDRRRLIGLTFKLIPARHRLGLIDESVRDRILKARRRFAQDLPDDLRARIEIFNEDGYNASATIQDNILFGKIAYGQSQATMRINRLIAEVVESLDLHETIMTVGLAYNVGVAGARLSAGQRQKTAIARALMKNPALLVLNEATAGLDGQSQTRIMNTIREQCKGRGVVWALHRPSLAQPFDSVTVLRSGTIAERGTFGDLTAKEGSTLNELIGHE